MSPWAASFFRRNAFLIGMAGVVVLSFVLPDAGRTLGQWGAKSWAVVAIFFMSGVTLSLGQVTRESSRWRCHLLVQGIVFGLVPLALWATAGWIPAGNMRNGVYLVACLPTTVSTCVIFTATARGNVPCALLNSVGGNLIGIALTPALLGILIGEGRGMDAALVWKGIGQLCLLALLPFAAGRTGVRLAPGLAGPVRKAQPFVAPGAILVIILCSFSAALHDLRSAASSMWQVFLYLAVAHLVFLAAAWVLTRAAGLATPEQTAVFFTATQKTLAMGAPLADAFFGVASGAVLTPLIFYHLFQLGVGGVAASFVKRRLSG